MTHVNDDVLAAIALDDPEVDPADRAHVAACPVCSRRSRSSSRCAACFVKRSV